MPQSAFGSGFGYGYGPLGTGLGLTSGVDFKCVDGSGNALPICFGIGAENHGLFQRLQQALNQLSTIGNFLPLTVDGFIGDQTVAAVNRLISSDSGTPFTKETIAAQVPSLVDQLTAVISDVAAQGQPLAPTGTPVNPTPASVASTGASAGAVTQIVAAVTAATAAAGAAASTAKPKKSIVPWILGGLATVAAVGVGGYFYYRHQIRTQGGWAGDDDFEGDEEGEFEGDGDFEGDDDLSNDGEEA